jgi:hypothetical protein
MEQEEKLELGRRIWELSKTGYDRIEVLRELRITVRQLEESLQQFESELSIDAGRAMAHYRNLDNERIEEVIEALMPIALDCPGTPEEVLAESEEAFDLRLKASYAVLGCIDARCKIISASRPERNSAKERSVDVLSWLQQLHTGTATHE